MTILVFDKSIKYDLLKMQTCRQKMADRHPKFSDFKNSLKKTTWNIAILKTVLCRGWIDASFKLSHDHFRSFWKIGFRCLMTQEENRAKHGALRDAWGDFGFSRRFAVNYHSHVPIAQEWFHPFMEWASDSVAINLLEESAVGDRVEGLILSDYNNE